VRNNVQGGSAGFDSGKRLISCYSCKNTIVVTEAELVKQCMNLVEELALI